MRFSAVCPQESQSHKAKSRKYATNLRRFDVSLLHDPSNRTGPKLQLAI